jgi:6-phospho-beta-glucosidase
MKIAVVGGGSTYTPELVDGVARLAGQTGVTELTLIDPDSARLEVVGPFSARIMRALGHPARVRWTTSLDEGLDGAGTVLLQLRIGGQAARQRDESWPLEYGCIGQETTGAGGFAKALRTVPVVLDIAEGPRRAPGSSTSPTRSASSPARCSTPATGRSGCATWRSASSARSPPCWGWTRTRSRSTTSA